MKNTVFTKILSCSLLIILSISLCLSGCDSDDYESSETTGEQITEATYDKRVALTFDDGPHETRTKEIVDALDKYGYNATFFVVGNRVDGSEYNGAEAMKYAIEHGNEIGIHGYTHNANYKTCSDTVYEYELSQTENAISIKGDGYKPSLMRPIGGSISNERISSCPYSVILWNVDSMDYGENKYLSTDTDEEKQAKVDRITENVISSVKDGSIILMHDIYQSTVDAAKIIIERLHQEGYDIVTVSELIGNPQPATRYSNG